MIRIALLGDSGAGKTQLKRSFVEQDYEENSLPTFGVERLKGSFIIQTSEKDTVVQNEHCKMILWDLAGQERFHVITSTYLRSVDVVMICIDLTKLTDPQQNLEKYIQQVKQNERQKDSTAIVVVGTKCDLVAESQKSALEVLAQEKGYKCFWVSAKTKVGAAELLGETCAAHMKPAAPKDQSKSKKKKINSSTGMHTNTQSSSGPCKRTSKYQHHPIRHMRRLHKPTQPLSRKKVTLTPTITPLPPLASVVPQSSDHSFFEQSNFWSRLRKAMGIGAIIGGILYPLIEIPTVLTMLAIGTKLLWIGAAIALGAFTGACFAGVALLLFGFALDRLFKHEYGVPLQIPVVVKEDQRSTEENAIKPALTLKEIPRATVLAAHTVAVATDWRTPPDSSSLARGDDNRFLSAPIVNESILEDRPSGDRNVKSC